MRYCATLLLLWLSHLTLADDGTTRLFELSLKELQEISVVSATKTSQSLNEAPATIRVISRKQILRRGYINLKQALADVPGLDIIDVHGAYSEIYSFRGSYGDENKRLLLLVDGIVQNSINGSFELGGPAYTLHNIERIEVIWGPASAVYGANAFSGIINLISRKPKNLVLEYARGIGSFDALYDSLFVAGSTQPWHYQLSAFRYRSDGPVFSDRHPKFSDAYIDNASQFSGNIGYTTESRKIAAGWKIYDNPVGDGTFGNAPTQFLGLPQPSPQNPGSDGWLNFDINGKPASLWHSYFRSAHLDSTENLNENLSLTSQFIYRETGVDDDSYSYPVNEDSAFVFRAASESRLWQFNTQLNIVIDNKSDLSFGIQFSDSNMEDGYRATELDSSPTEIDGITFVNWNGGLQERGKIIELNRSALVQYRQQLETDFKTELTIGSRYDNNSIYGSSFNPRVGLVTHLTPSLTIKALYGSAYRAPSVFELYSSSPVRQPNPDLDPETVDSYELAVEYLYESFALKSVLFQNNLNNVIVEGIDIGDGFTQIQNSGKSTIRGVESIWLHHWSKQLKTRASYSYQEGTFKDQAQQRNIVNVPKNKLKLSLDYSFKNGFTTHWMSHYIGDIQTVRSNPVNRINEYWVSHFSITSPKYFHDRVNFSLRINNILDKNYAHPGHRTADGASYSPVNEQPGRTFQARFTLSL